MKFFTHRNGVIVMSQVTHIDLMLMKGTCKVYFAAGAGDSEESYIDNVHLGLEDTRRLLMRMAAEDPVADDSWTKLAANLQLGYGNIE